jgi:hypothetical protein
VPAEPLISSHVGVKPKHNWTSSPHRRESLAWGLMPCGCHLAILNNFTFENVFHKCNPMGHWSMLRELGAFQSPQDGFLAACPMAPTLSLVLIAPGRSLAVSGRGLGRAPRRVCTCPENNTLPEGVQLQIAKKCHGDRSTKSAQKREKSSC